MPPLHELERQSSHPLSTRRLKDHPDTTKQHTTQRPRPSHPAAPPHRPPRPAALCGRAAATALAASCWPWPSTAVGRGGGAPGGWWRGGGKVEPECGRGGRVQAWRGQATSGREKVAGRLRFATRRIMTGGETDTKDVHAAEHIRLDEGPSANSSNACS